MNQQGEHLKNGFQLYDCTVFPSRNLIVSSKGEQHIEPKAMQVLLILAAQPEVVISREHILEQVWSETYSGDDALTRCICLLRSSLGENKQCRRFIETVSKSGYRLIAPVGIPVVDKTTNLSGKNKKSTMRLMLFAITAVVAIGIYFYLSSGIKMTNSKSLSTTNINQQKAALNGPSIAVMPFVNMSNDPENEYFSDGISEEILNVLAQIPSLKVTSRSSSFSFKGKDIIIADIANKLGVENILEGSVRKFDNRIRISVQLIQAKSDSHLWSATYDRELTDLLAIQEDIAKDIAAALKITLDIESPLLKHNPSQITNLQLTAYDAYFKGRFLMEQRTKRALEDAIQEFNKALTIAPDNPLAHAELSTSYLLLNTYGDLSKSEALQRAKPHAMKAISLGPDLAQSHAAMGYYSWRNGEHNSSMINLQQAVAINPNYAIVHHWLSWILGQGPGQYQQSFYHQEIAYKLNPTSIPVASRYITLLIDRGRLPKAAIELKKLQDISLANYFRIRARLNTLNGQWSLGALDNLNALLIDPKQNYAKWSLARHFVFLGLADDALALFKSPKPLLLSYLGDYKKAVVLAEARINDEPDSILAKSRLGTVLAFSGKYENAQPILEQIWQREKTVTRVSRRHFLLIDALSLFVMRKREGDEKGAEELLLAIKADVQRARKAGLNTNRPTYSTDYEEGIALYFSGMKDEGILLMAKAVNDGFFIPTNATFLNELYNDSAFARTLAMQKATQERERRKFLHVVCNDNPFKRVWEPTASACRSSEQ